GRVDDLRAARAQVAGARTADRRRRRTAQADDRDRPTRAERERSRHGDQPGKSRLHAPDARLASENRSTIDVFHSRVRAAASNFAKRPAETFLRWLRLRVVVDPVDALDGQP